MTTPNRLLLDEENCLVYRFVNAREAVTRNSPGSNALFGREYRTGVRPDTIYRTIERLSVDQPLDAPATTSETKITKKPSNHWIFSGMLGLVCFAIPSVKDGFPTYDAMFRDEVKSTFSTIFVRNVILHSLGLMFVLLSVRSHANQADGSDPSRP